MDMNGTGVEINMPPTRPVIQSSELQDLQIRRGHKTEEEAEEKLLTFDKEWLDLSRSVIEEKETKVMARALESDRIVNLKVLFLHKNAGDVGMRAMLNALTLGYLHGLEKLILWEVSSYDQITTAEEGTDTIADALGKGKVPALHTLDLTGSLPKLTAPRTWRRVFGDLFKLNAGSGRLNKFMDICFRCMCLKPGAGNSQTLDCLRCQFFQLNVFTGDDGVRKIVRALGKNPMKSLKILNLGENYIGDTGVGAVAKLLAEGKLPQLEELDLQNNPVGKVGAEKIVQAYLDNPLLTVRVKMDWPTLLLKERASAFRECNIRLEHRLAELNITVEHDRKSPKFEWRPDYFLQRPTSRIQGYKLPHRLYMKCQKCPEEEDALPQGDGIQIRRRSCFGTSSRKFVDRELHELPDEEIELRDESMPSRRSGASASGSNRGSTDAPSAGPSMYQTLTADVQGPSPPALSSSSTSIGRSAKSSGRNSVRAQPQDPQSLPRHKGENHIYITAGSCGFIGAAKALGLKTKKGFWRACYSFIRKSLQNQMKTQEHIDSIMEELLMLADRKPHEFHQMFNLRRVLLRDIDTIYYPAYICSSCYSRLEASGDFVKPVVHPTLLDVSTSPGPITPISPPPAGKPYPRPFPKYEKQPSRLS